MAGEDGLVRLGFKWREGKVKAGLRLRSGGGEVACSAVAQWSGRPSVGAEGRWLRRWRRLCGPVGRAQRCPVDALLCNEEEGDEKNATQAKFPRGAG